MNNNDHECTYGNEYQNTETGERSVITNSTSVEECDEKVNMNKNHDMGSNGYGIGPTVDDRGLEYKGSRIDDRNLEYKGDRIEDRGLEHTGDRIDDQNLEHTSDRMIAIEYDQTSIPVIPTDDEVICVGYARVPRKYGPLTMPIKFTQGDQMKGSIIGPQQTSRMKNVLVKSHMGSDIVAKKGLDPKGIGSSVGPGKELDSKGTGPSVGPGKEMDPKGTGPVVESSEACRAEASAGQNADGQPLTEDNENPVPDQATAPASNGESSDGQYVDDPNSEYKACRICGDKALGYNFNVISCESCKAFFRRNALKSKDFRCPFKGNCTITVTSRRFCQRCRLKKCFELGMKKEWILSEQALLERRQRNEEKRINFHLQAMKEQAKRQASLMMQYGGRLPNNYMMTPYFNQNNNYGLDYANWQQGSSSWNSALRMPVPTPGQATFTAVPIQAPAHVQMPTVPMNGVQYGATAPVPYGVPRANAGIVTAPMPVGMIANGTHSWSNGPAPSAQMAFDPSRNMVASSLMRPHAQAALPVRPYDEMAEQEKQVHQESDTNLERQTNALPVDMINGFSLMFTSKQQRETSLTLPLKSHQQETNESECVSVSKSMYKSSVAECSNSSQDLSDEEINATASQVTTTGQVTNDHCQPSVVNGGFQSVVAFAISRASVVQSSSTAHNVNVQASDSDTSVQNLDKTVTVRSGIGTIPIQCTGSESITQPLNGNNVPQSTSATNVIQSVSRPSVLKYAHSVSAEQSFSGTNVSPVYSCHESGVRDIMNRQSVAIPNTAGVIRPVPMSVVRSARTVQAQTGPYDLHPANSPAIEQLPRYRSNVSSSPDGKESNESKTEQQCGKLGAHGRNVWVQLSSEDSFILDKSKLEGNHPSNLMFKLKLFRWVRLEELVAANRIMSEPVDGVAHEKHTLEVHLVSDGSDMPKMTNIDTQRLVRMCQRISAFRNLCQHDQVALLKGSCRELLSLKGLTAYNARGDSFDFGQTKLMTCNNNYEDKQYMESLEGVCNRDERIMATVTTLALFYPERINIVHKHVVCKEYDFYVDLLKSYLTLAYANDGQRYYDSLLDHLCTLRARLNTYSGVKLFFASNAKELEPLLLEALHSEERRDEDIDIDIM